MSDVVVLLGPPGSGKSTIGQELVRLGLRWREWELTILERWGSRANFVANKAEGIRILHDEMWAHIETPGPPAALETTGLSDAPFLDRLQAEHAVFVVRIDVTEKEAARRVRERERERHLTDDVVVSLDIWHAFYERVAPHRRADLVIDSEQMSPASAAASIVEALAPEAAPLRPVD